MFFRIINITGTVISLLLAFVCFFSLFTQWNASDFETIIVGITILITQILFLAFNFVCNKMLTYNKRQTQISDNLKLAGKTTLILNIIAAIVILFCCLVLIASSLEFNNRYIFLLILSFFLLSGIISIINVFYFIQISRENKTILSLLVDGIGAGKEL